MIYWKNWRSIPLVVLLSCLSPSFWSSKFTLQLCWFFVWEIMYFSLFVFPSSKDNSELILVIKRYSFKVKVNLPVISALIPLITGLFLLWFKVLDREDLEEIWLEKRISSSHFKYSLEFVRLISSTSTPLWFSICNLIFKNCLPSFWKLISSFLASLFFWLRLYINPYKILIKGYLEDWLK